MIRREAVRVVEYAKRTNKRVREKKEMDKLDSAYYLLKKAFV